MVHDAYIRPYLAINVNNEWDDITNDGFGLDGKSGIAIIHGQANQTSRVSYGQCDIDLNNTSKRYNNKNPNSDLYGLLNTNVPFRIGIDYLVSNFGTPVTDGWGSTDTDTIRNTPGLPWTLDGTASAFDVASGTGTIVSTGTDTRRVAYLNSYGEAEALVKFKISSLTDDPLFGLVFQYKDSSEFYAVYFDTSGTDSIRLISHIGGGGTIFFAPAIGFSIAADTYYWMHMSAGRRIRANVWPDSGAERTDGAWDLDIHDNDPFNAGFLERHGGVGPFISLGTNTTVLTVDYFEVFNPRFYGEIPSFIPSADKTNQYLFTKIQSAGIFRRLRVGEQSNLLSAFSRDATKPSTLQYAAIYYPGEDSSGSIAPSSGLSNGIPMTVQSVIPTFGSTAGIPGSAPLMTMGAGGLSCSIPTTPDTTGAIYYRMVMVAPATELANNAIICHIYTSTGNNYRLIYGTGGSLKVEARNSENTLLDNTSNLGFGITAGQRIYISMELVQDGADVDILWAVNKISDDGTTISGSLGTDTFPSLTLGRGTDLWVGRDGSLSGAIIGHIGIGNNQQFMFSSDALIGFAGETTAERIERLCEENDLPFYLVGDSADSALVGPQQIATLETNFQLAADTDQGILFEPRTALAVGYITRRALYDQLAIEINYSGKYLDDVLNIVEDDTLKANDATATNVTGGFSRYVVEEGPNNYNPPPEGIGVYHPNPPLNVIAYNRTDLAEIAQLRTHIGTWDAPRIPIVSVNYMRTQLKNNESLRAQILALSEGNYLQIINLPDWQLPSGEPLDLMSMGYKETIGQLMATAVLNTVPYGPYLIGTVEEGNARAAGGTDIVLVSSVSNSATTFVVASLSGDQRWCTATDDAESSSDFPMGATIEGERVSITAVSSRATDTFTRTTSNGWGNATSGQTYSHVGTLADFSTTGTLGRIATVTANSLYYGTLDTGHTNHKIKIFETLPVVPTGAPFTLRAVGRFTDSSNYYEAQISVATTGVATLTLRKRVAGADSQIGTDVVVGTHAAGNVWAIIFEVHNTMLRAKAWNSSTSSEPDQWLLKAIGQTDLTAGTRSGAGVRRDTGNTNGSTNVDYDNLDISLPQLLTVTRSVNGIVKAHSSNVPIDVVDRAYVGR